MPNPIRLVIDANILIAAFLKAASTRNLLLDARIELFSPEHLLVETRKVLHERFAKRWEQDSDSFDELFSALTGEIHVLPKEDYISCIGKAMEIAPHAEDAPYLACAMHLNMPLWSNDSGMKDQPHVKVLTTTELIEALSSP